MQHSEMSLLTRVLCLPVAWFYLPRTLPHLLRLRRTPNRFRDRVASSRGPASVPQGPRVLRVASSPWSAPRIGARDRRARPEASAVRPGSRSAWRRIFSRVPPDDNFLPVCACIGTCILRWRRGHLERAACILHVKYAIRPDGILAVQCVLVIGAKSEL